LDPVYKVSTAPHTSVHARFSEEQVQGVEVTPALQGEVGHVHGSKSRQLHRDNREPQLSLATQDIHGCVPQRFVGSVPANIYDHPDMRPMISFHDPGDIAGAQVSSLRKGLEGSYRTTNPLNPRYQTLDGTVLPHPGMPVMDTERGPAHHLHPGHAPLMHSLNNGSGFGRATSLPDLAGGVAGVMNAGSSRVPSSRGGVPSSRGGGMPQQTLPRDRSEGALRQSPAASLRQSPAASIRSGGAPPPFLTKPGF
jgi:hypothetical protein